MKIIIHEAGQKPLKVISFQDEKEVFFEEETIVGVLWELAIKFPEEVVGWCDELLQPEISKERWEQVFHHDLIMASYAVSTSFLPESIGYVDQLPFVNVQRNVPFPTWKMSRDVGGITGKTLLEFKRLQRITSFEYLLNSISKIGQQNGLFCYSSPSLVKRKTNENLNFSATSLELFQFVGQHYKRPWLLVLFFAFFRYEGKFPLWPFLKHLFQKSSFQAEVDLPAVEGSCELDQLQYPTIDVLIPTLDRADHLRNVLKDLSQQSLCPARVIVIEQNPDPDSVSELDFLKEAWPFEVIHHFTHRTGACFSRNLGLAETTANWVFFADDDIRIQFDLLEKAVLEAAKLKVRALSMNCVQKGESTIFPKVKQWGSFGAGSSLVAAKFAKSCRFSAALEHGYGEDVDFGNQLRRRGCDIIYHPELEVLHLKAGRGGFRTKNLQRWQFEDPVPKPSPTLMVIAQKYSTAEQLKGFKISLFLKFYPKQSIKNPLSYIQHMNQRWELSEIWAKRLLSKEES